jgi:hypothetical protein
MRFRILNKDYFFDYREACKITQGTDLWVHNDGWKPRDARAYWIKQIVGNHSCIRSIHFRLVDTRPKTVINQIIRATKGHPQPEVETSRPDWTGKERSFDPYEDKLFMQDHTAESFIEMAKQRLCMKTEERTRDFMAEMVRTLRQSKDPFLQAVGYCCAPACSWYGKRCPEPLGCGKCPSLAAEIIGLYKRCSGIALYDKKEEAEIAMERR